MADRFAMTSLLEDKSAAVEIAPVAAEGNLPPIPAPAFQGSKGFGLEVANIAALPDSEDYAQDPFYRANFTAAEIARCGEQPGAKGAFQSLLAAKRAIVKSGAAREPAEGFNGIEIGFDGEGRPSYPGCLLSLSDTGAIAAAACLWLGGIAWPGGQTAAPAQAARAQPKVIPVRIRILAAFVALSLLVLFGIGSMKILEFLRR